MYKDFDWADLIRSGSLLKLTVKEQDKYTDHHHLQCKYLSKKKTFSLQHIISTVPQEWTSNNRRTQWTQVTKKTKKCMKMVRILF